MADEDDEFSMTPEQKEASLRQNRLLYSGLIAISIVILQAFLETSSMNLPAMIAVVSFAISLPHLGVMVMIEDWPSPEGFPVLGLLPTIAKSLGVGFAVIGVGAAFWYISWIAGVVVIISGIGAFTSLTVYQDRVMFPQVKAEVDRANEESRRACLDAGKITDGGDAVSGEGRESQS